MLSKNSITYRLTAKYGLFTDPATRLGGEKCTYPVPTYQALKGITESIYWEPTITWVIDRVRIMNAIHTESKNIRPINYNKAGNTLSVYTYLQDVSYQVQAHFIWNPYREDFAKDRNENKHSARANRYLNAGGTKDIFVGTRECQGYVEPCVFGEGVSVYDNTGKIPLGVMFHGFDYPDETGRNMLAARFWKPVMKNGVIEFLPPWKCDRALCRDIRPMQMKQFPQKYPHTTEEGEKP